MTIESGTERSLNQPEDLNQSGADGPASDAKEKVHHVAGAAVDEGKNVAHTAVDATKDVAHEATSQVATVAGEARQQLSSVVEQAKGELRAQFDQRGQQAATGLQTFADQLSALAEGRPEAAGQVGSLLGDAQQRVQAYAQTLQRRGPQGLVDDVNSFARRRPGMFLLVAGVAGFAAGRLARAGSAAGKASAVSSMPPPTTPQIGSAFEMGGGFEAGATSGSGAVAQGRAPIAPALTEPVFAEPVQVER